MNPSGTAVEAVDLVKVYAEHSPHPVRALDGISLTVREGEIYGLLGENGAGKTTLLRILTTLIRPTSGRASVLGLDVTRHAYEVRRRICTVFQENAVEVFLSVEDNLGTYARFHGIPRRAIRERALQAMERFGLESVRSQKVIDLSGGLKRRVQVAKVFMVDSPVVFLDEATTGMDPINRRATLDAIRDEARRGRTILLTTHLLEEAEELCDTIALIGRGSLVAVGTPERIKTLGRAPVEIRVTYETLPADATARLARFPLARLERRHTTLELSVSANLVSPFEVLLALGELGPVRTFEVSSGSLEDAFLQLLGKKKPGETS